VAWWALALSGAMCLVAPLIPSAPTIVGLAILIVWGLTAPADSPQFSALSARACPPEAVGSALALQNAIGFSITVASVQFSAALLDHAGNWMSWIWLPGPILGLFAMRPFFWGHSRQP
jgi:hypothetical protein